MDRGLSVFRVLICNQKREKYIKKEEKRELNRSHKEDIDCPQLIDRSKPTRFGFTGRRRSDRGEERRRSRRGEERRRSVGGERPRHLSVLDLGLGLCGRFLG